MKKFPSLVTFLLLVLAVYWGYRSSMPHYESDESLAQNQFSTANALRHVEKISQKPHAVGFSAHTEVREYIVSELEKMGLEPVLQEGYTAGDWANFSKAVNILARIEGTEKGKALLLLSHYDSNPHSSLGASDAGSGVATILEGVRAFLSGNKKPKNDIIILITDAEELGLNGADLFVNQHPWAKDVGLVLNFEARGSGGSSYTFMETNRGNQNLVHEFIKANPKYPMANSLYYSIYKMLPNDTDLTVFREDRDIDGFNFAFIDDHFDYHTAQDSYERMDKNTLAHQGSYLMPLLHHFSTVDLSNLKSLNDYVYFNIPVFGMVSYPFDWIWPMFTLAVFIFIILLIRGFRQKKLHLQDVLLGFLPLLIALIINGTIGYFAWPFLEGVYPQYSDMLHGFTYNGHTYILAFVLVTLAVCFYTYQAFDKIRTPSLIVAPVLIWLAICAAIAVYLKGASFFIIPVFALLTAWFVILNQKEPSPLLMVILALPAVWLYAPLIQGFTVGLGLKMLVASTLLTTLLFLLLLPIFGFFRNKKAWAHASLIFFLGCLVWAHFNSGFDAQNAKPSSLLYIQNLDRNTAHWATYDRVLTEWNEGYFLNPDETSKEDDYFTLSSKYRSHFTQVSEAPSRAIPVMSIEKIKDTIVGSNRVVGLRITPQRNINRLEVFTNDIPLVEAKMNGLDLSPFYLKNRRSAKLLTHYVSDNAYTELILSVPKDSVLELTLYEASNDLLENELFEIPQRPTNSIPMPFVLNDAILTIKQLRFD